MNKQKTARYGLIAAIAILLILFFVIMINLVKAVSVKPAKKSYVWHAGNLETTVNLETSYSRAREKAATWQTDVQLIRIESDWHPEGNWKSVEHPPVVWSFVFFSPSKQAIATASVDDETVYWTKPRVISQHPATLSGCNVPPSTGSDVVWYALLAVGGEELLQQYSDVLVHFLYQPSKDNTNSCVWLAYGVTRDDNGHYVEVTVDPNSGRVISSVP